MVDTLFTETADDGTTIEQIVWKWSPVDSATLDGEVAA